ncbi:MAG: DegT/DnrJ/EryC1/StrS family aminotransferase, partial [Candidatus Omnitrophica bacterium]|nr:DegT/DnrJ/EryC1/StrS family aminotransferase [Candidatus Omnitrophota bacterium]
GSRFISEFEEIFAKYVGVPYCHSCTNGTQAILIALQALGIKPGDEVITTPYTFIGTISPIMALHAIPRFVDISEADYLIDLDKVEQPINENTKAIIVVHLAGCPVDMERVLEIAAKHNLSVIEDCAQAHGAEWKDKRVGSWGDLGTFSFQTSKNMSAGEGGAVTAKDETLSLKVFGAKNCGRVPGGLWYMHESFGTNLRLSAWQAALLTTQIDTIDEHNQRRDRNARLLGELLLEIEGVEAVAVSPEGVTSHARHLVLFRYESGAFGGLSRAKFLKAAVAEGIPIASGYVPLYRQGAMR